MSFLCKNQELNEEQTEEQDMNRLVDRLNTNRSDLSTSRRRKGISLSKNHSIQNSPSSNIQNMNSGKIISTESVQSRKPLSKVNRILDDKKRYEGNQELQMKGVISNKLNKMRAKDAQQRETKIDHENSHFYHKHQNLQKIMHMYKEKEQKQFKECTFNPKINNASKSPCPRSIDKFYTDQINYCQKAGAKIDEMRDLIELEKQKQTTFKPQISNTSKYLTSRRSTVRVYDRLYSREKGNPQSKEQTIESQTVVSKKGLLTQQSSSKDLMTSHSIKTFRQLIGGSNCQGDNRQNAVKDLRKLQRPASTNKLTKDNEKKVAPSFTNSSSAKDLDCQMLLRNAGLSSRNDSDRKTTPRNNSNAKIGEKVERRNLVSKNERIALEKFIKQIISILHIMGVGSFLSYNQFIELCLKLNFTRKPDSGDSQQIKDQQLLDEIWDILQGNSQLRVTTINVAKVLCCVAGFQEAKLVQKTLKRVFEANSEISGEMAEILASFSSGTEVQGLLFLSNEDSKTIRQNFNSLHMTRFEQGESELVKKHEDPIYSFKPSISKQSEALAQKYRERVLKESEQLIQNHQIDFEVPEGGLLEHADLLVLDQKRMSCLIQKSRIERQTEKRRLEQESMIQYSHTHRSDLSSIYRNNSMEGGSRQSRRHMSRENDISHNFSRISHNEEDSSNLRDHLLSLEQGKTRQKVKSVANQKSHQNSVKSFRNDRSRDGFQYQNSKEELTFTPKLTDYHLKSQNNTQNSKEIPNFSKEVYRMQQKRNKQNSRPASQSLQNPLLYLNVSMQGYKNVKVPVMASDDFQSLTEEVRLLMNIEDCEQEKEKLKGLLETQIVPVLTRFSKTSGTSFKLLTDARPRHE